MWETARAKLREWYIVIVGVALIAGGFFLASHQPSSTAPSSTALSSAAPSAVAQADKSPPSPPAQASQPAPWAGPSATSTPSERVPSPAASAPAAREAAAEPVAQTAPEHGMAQPMSTRKLHAAHDGPRKLHDQQDGCRGRSHRTPQLSPLRLAAPPTAGGDPAAGRLVFQKMPGVPFDRARQGDPRSFARRHCRAKGGPRARLQLLAGHEAGQHRLGCQVAGCLSERSAEGRPGNKMPFPGLKTEHDRADVIASLPPAPRRRPQQRRSNRRAFTVTVAAATTNARAQQSARKPHPTPTPATSRMPNTRCDRASPKAAWSISASAARSTAR